MSTTVDNNNQFGGGSGEETECKDNVNTITEGIVSVAILDDTSTCACCGKDGNSDNMNTCNKCQSVKYCNAACKKKHRSKHKKACERRLAALHEEKLFKEIEPEECPLCMLPLPLDADGSSFKACCGKEVCNGCNYAMRDSEGNESLCPYCRAPPPSSEKDKIKCLEKLMDNGNSYAYNVVAFSYDTGINGLPKDKAKAIKLYLKAGELGCADACFNLGLSYDKGYGVEVDKEKSKHYWTLSALTGYIHEVRHSLGNIEFKAGNTDRAIKHWIIAARAGHEKALNKVKIGFMSELVTKDEYASTLRAYHERQQEMKSDERDKAAASGVSSLCLEVAREGCF